MTSILYYSYFSGFYIYDYFNMGRTYKDNFTTHLDLKDAFYLVGKLANVAIYTAVLWFGLPGQIYDLPLPI